MGQQWSPPPQHWSPPHYSPRFCPPCRPCRPCCQVCPCCLSSCQVCGYRSPCQVCACGLPLGYQPKVCGHCSPCQVCGHRSPCQVCGNPLGYWPEQRGHHSLRSHSSLQRRPLPQLAGPTGSLLDLSAKMVQPSY